MAYIWGRNPIREAFRARRKIDKVYVAAGARSAGALAEVIAMAADQHVPVVGVPVATLDRMAAGANHQGIIAEAAAFAYCHLDDLLDAEHTEPALLLILDHLVDPQNFGTLLRTAEAIGAHGVVIPRERSVGVTPAVEKASAGAVEHLAIAQVVNVPRALDTMKERGLWIFGLDASATTSYDRVDYNRPIALVVGSEGRGLSRLAREHCDVLVKLPMRGRVESLNAAVAGSIVMYHIWRNRGS